MLKKQTIFISLLAITTCTYASSSISTPPDFPDYKLEQITKLIKSSDRHRMENRQKEMMKQSRKKMGAFNSYASPQFLAKKISDSELPHAKKVEKEDDTFVSKSDKYTTSIPVTATGDIVLKVKKAKSFEKSSLKQNNYNLSISLPNQNTKTFIGKAKVAEDNSVIYKDYQENTDVIVQAFNKSTRILTIINDADAPTEYLYNVNLPQGSSMKKLKNGGIEILNSNKEFIGGFAPPWAIDKNGKKIPTRFELNGNSLTQVVEHLNANVTYPVVADPWYGDTLVDHTEWQWIKYHGTHTEHDFKLNVYTTFWARYYSFFTAGDAGWNEIRGMTCCLPQSNPASLRLQYICHVVAGWWIPREFHLEEYRPVVSWNDMIRAHCNPSGHI